MVAEEGVLVLVEGATGEGEDNGGAGAMTDLRGRREK